jgi:tetratricopeptide (TPR) repeat protein
MHHDDARGWLPVTTASEAARARFERGRAAAHHYQFEQAVEHLEAALAEDPAFVLALLHRGGSAGDADECRTFLDAADAHRDHVSDGERRLIDAFRAFLLDGEYERAIEILHGLADTHTADPYLPSYLGFRYYRNLKRYEEASEQFRLALARDPGFVQAYNWLGYIAMDQADYATAEAMFERYLAEAPDEPRAHDSMGVFALRRGRPQEAIHHFERALARDARFEESQIKLGRARAALADTAPEDQQPSG